VNTKDLTNEQAQCLMDGVRLSRNGLPWRMEGLKEELRKRGYSAEDVEVAMGFWEAQERDKLTQEQQDCVRRALVLSQHAISTAKSVRNKLEYEGHAPDAVAAAMDVCEKHQVFDGPPVRWSPETKS